MFWMRSAYSAYERPARPDNCSSVAMDSTGTLQMRLNFIAVANEQLRLFCNTLERCCLEIPTASANSLWVLPLARSQWRTVRNGRCSFFAMCWGVMQFATDQLEAYYAFFRRCQHNFDGYLKKT